VALTGAVCCISQWLAMPVSFSHTSAADNLDAAKQVVATVRSGK